jgi:hypothetical protein
LKLYMKIVIMNMHLKWYFNYIFTLSLTHMYLYHTANSHNIYHQSGHNYDKETLLINHVHNSVAKTLKCVSEHTHLS